MQSPPFNGINQTLTENTSDNLKYFQQQLNGTQYQFSPIQLQNRLIYHKQHEQDTHHMHPQSQNQQPQQQQDIAFINSNSIVKRYQLLLITCLIISSIASVKYSNDGTFYHVKNIRNYFNYFLLGNQYLGLYQFGDNIDQSQLQLTDFQDINQHYVDLVDLIYNFTDTDGFVQFTQDTDEDYVEVEVFYLDQVQPEKQIMTINDFQIYLSEKDFRDFLLSIESMSFKFNFGQNKRLQDLNMTVSYEIHSSMMLQISLQFQYQPNPLYKQNKNDYSIRIIQQLLGFFLLCSYLHNLYIIQVQNSKLKQLKIFYDDIRTLQKNRSYWCYSLIFLNFITILSQTYAPLASFLQLLPIFQRHDSLNLDKYNFNTNLRYALPLVMTIFIPVVIFLNGFVFYSILMYPGEYFQDYTMGLFSYVYQNFQVGTYQIFTELKDQGDFAYFLYGILYFYMVLVGNNLIPALFCTMIFIKMYQKDIKQYISRTVKTAICPKCNHQNFDDAESKSKFQLNISSPVISPYLKGKLLTKNHTKKQQKDDKLKKNFTKMYVQQQQTKYFFDINQYLKTKVQKIKSLSKKLELITNQSTNYRQKQIFLERIQKLAKQVEDIIVSSPQKSILKHK